MKRGSLLFVIIIAFLFVDLVSAYGSYAGYSSSSMRFSNGAQAAEIASSAPSAEPIESALTSENEVGMQVAASFSYSLGTPFPFYCGPFDPFFYRYCYYPYIYSVPVYSMYSPSYYYAYPIYVQTPGRVLVATQAQDSSMGVQRSPCSDGTSSGYCSSREPKFCFDGNLFDKASLCGCLEGQTQDSNNQDKCIQATCNDGTLVNSCSQSKPNYCTLNQVLVERPLQCGCPKEQKLVGSTCQPLESRCSTSSNPNVITNGASNVITVNYNEFPFKPSGFIDCGNGQLEQLTCTGNNQGSCTATCSYGNFASLYSQALIKANLNGKQCSAITVKTQGVPLVNVLGTTSAIIKVTNCNSNTPVQGASIAVTSVHLLGENAAGELTSDVLISNQLGEAELGLFQQGLYDVFVSKNNYSRESATINILRGRIQITPICLNSNSLATQNQDVPRQRRLAEEEMNPPLVARVVNSQNASQQPMRAIALKAFNNEKNSFPGERICFELLVENNGMQSEEIKLFAVNLNQENFEVKFNQDAFELGAKASKKIEACVQSPQANALEKKRILIRALANSLQAEATDQVLILNLKQTPQLKSNQCIAIDNTKTLQYVPIEIINPSETSNFEVELDAIDVNARVVTPAIFNFKNQEVRQVTIAISPKSMQTKQAKAVLRLKNANSKVKVLEQEICMTASFQNKGATVGLLSNFLQLNAGQEAVTFLKIINTGALSATYTISSIFDETTSRSANNTIYGIDSNNIQGIKLKISNSLIELKPNEEKQVTITLQAASNLASATYSIPIYVYSNANGEIELIATPSITTAVQEQPTTATLDLNAQVPQVQVNEQTKQVIATIQIQNTEKQTRVINTTLITAPNGWNAEVNPQEMQLLPGQIGEFQYTFTAADLTSQDTSVTVKFTDELSRESTLQVPIPLKSQNLVTPTTSLFTLRESTNAIALAILFTLTLAGLILLAKAYNTRKQLAANQ